MKFLSQLLRQQASDAPARLEPPAYYEVWGSLESANRALWMALWLATSVALLALLMVRIQLSRPPVVIRVDGGGEAAVLPDAAKQQLVTAVEIKNFAGTFERFFMELNFYTYEGDLKRAFSMMTQSFAAKANEGLKGAGTIDALKANQTRTTLVLTDMKIDRETADFIECKVRGYRQLASYLPDGPSGEVVFEHDLILKKVRRSESAPYGLLVEDFNETVFKR